MAVEPKTVRETSLVIAGIEARLDLVQKMVWAVIALLGTLVAGAGALYFQIGDLKTDVAVIKTNAAAINEKVSKIETSIDDVRSAGNLASTTLGRIETRLDTAASQGRVGGPGFLVGLTLSSDETQLIRAVLKPVLKGVPQQFKVGDLLEPGIFVAMLPREITSKFLRLSGLLYFTDRSGALMLVASIAPGYNVIVGTVTPA
jgi:outer membrane murein-binding lipoprotein Lpp